LLHGDHLLCVLLKKRADRLITLGNFQRALHRISG
jgi:hypothetical protein